jgi:hypothetical protein
MQALRIPRPKALTITTVRYERVKNLGNYETQRFSAEATVNPGDDPQSVSQQLMSWVDAQLVTETADEDF